MLIRPSVLSNGLGRHIWSLDPKDRAAKARKWILVEFIDELFIITANGFAKFAVYVISATFQEVIGPLTVANFQSIFLLSHCRPSSI